MNSIPTTQFIAPGLDRTTRHVPDLTIMPITTTGLGIGYCAPISALNNRFEGFDDDPLTAEKMADLAISYRELAEGKGIILSKDMSDEDFLANL